MTAAAGGGAGDGGGPVSGRDGSWVVVILLAVVLLVSGVTAAFGPQPGSCLWVVARGPARPHLVCIPHR